MMIMSTTATEKLTKIRKYVERMSPVYRIALHYPADVQAFHNGYDAGMADAQKELLALLESD